MTNINAVKSLNAAQAVATNPDPLIDAIMEDLGESPEALRGAFVVCASLRALTQYIIGRGVDDDDDQTIEAQMAGTGIAATALIMALGDRLNKLIGDK